MIKITDKRENNIIDAGELNVGDVFVRQGSYYLRIEGDNYLNAINLETMDYAEILSDETVIRVAAELVIHW